MQLERLAVDRKLDVECGQFVAGRQLLDQRHVLLVGRVDVKAEIQLRHEVVGIARQKGRHQFGELGIIPAEHGLDAIIDHFAVVFNLADDLLEFIFGQVDLGHDQIKRQGRQGKTAHRTKPEDKARVGYIKAGIDHAHFGNKVQNSQVIPTGRNFKANGDAIATNVQIGRERLGLLRHRRIQEGQRCAHKAFGWRNFPPIAAVGEVGFRQVHRRVRSHETVDIADVPASAVIFLDEDLIPKGDVCFALIAVVIDLDVFASSRGRIYCGRKHRALGRDLGCVL